MLLGATVVVVFKAYTLGKGKPTALKQRHVWQRRARHFCKIVIDQGLL